ncbi:hypothetical protein [Spectribacter hydrogenoxidans]|uniref:DUF3108 domain-containing protein n=1 Tax=Spectribacter hydrogenoxidans TaxID=3075608 RepID=A0ABU3BXZ8_9GAMM|nr:hypothetical protein [Salinisphaera sp. W335]MDT0634158.1 hypothetical protein [Salinisphaera sp. W335]
MRTAVLIATCLLSAPALAADGNTHCFTGYGYELESNRFAYTEHHEQMLDDAGRPVDWTVTYRDPDGEVIARKTLDFSHNEFVPVYRMRMIDSGYVEGIERDASGWRMFRRDGENAEHETEPFELTDNLAADSGFHPFLQSRFDTLMDGETRHFRFAAAGRQSAFDLQVARIEDTKFEGETAVRFEAELDMWLVSFFVDSLVLTYDPHTRELLEYRGIGNLHDAEGETYPVRVAYYSEPPDEAGDVATSCGGD